MLIVFLWNVIVVWAGLRNVFSRVKALSGTICGMEQNTLQGRELARTRIVKNLKNSVEHGRVITTFNMMKH